MLIKKTFLIFSLILLSSCGIMPGMENLQFSATQQSALEKNKTKSIEPNLISITPELISNQKIAKYVYSVAPADVLNISIWQHPEFSSPMLHATQVSGLPSVQGSAGQEGFLVNSDGYIYFPLIGNFLVAGKSIDVVRKQLTKKLTRYIKNPELNVRVVDFRGRKVYVLGEVKKPGFIPLNDQPLSITDAIVLTGGLDSSAADPSHIYVIRGKFTKPDVYWLNAKTPDALLLAEHFNLQPGDILFVSSAPATRWNRVINQLLPTIQTVWYTKAIVDSSR